MCKWEAYIIDINEFVKWSNIFGEYSKDIVEKDISLAITTMVHHALIHYSNFIKFTVMKKILFFLFAFLAFQYTVAQSIFERKSIGNNVYVSTNTSEKKAESIRNFSFAEESLYAPPVFCKDQFF